MTNNTGARSTDDTSLTQWITQARTAFRGNNLPEAERICRALLQESPNSVDALNLLGVLTAQTQRASEGVEWLTKAATLAPNRADVHGNLGNVLRELSREEEALACFNRVIDIDAGNAQAFYLRGMVLRGLKRHPDALQSYNEAIDLTSDDPDYHFARSQVLGEMEKYGDALASCELALTLKPDHLPALVNRGNALGRLRRHEEALECFERALRIAPNSAELHSNLGVVQYAMQRREEAYQSFSRALEIDPNHQYAASNIAGFYLQQGDFAKGWDYYEHRWVEQQQTQTLRDFRAPRWHGEESLEGKTILLHSEQGFGDTIHFCRYAKLVTARGARVILEVQSALLPLLSGVEGASQVLQTGDSVPAVDYHCPLMSLGLAFKTDLTTIPSDIPYVQHDPRRSLHWQSRLGAKSRPRIGIVWCGNPAHKNDHNRSIALTQWLPLFTNDNVEWHSLGKEVRDSDQAVLASHPQIRHWGSELRDFSDTAALTDLMDLVITVDTSIAHLAGAMGKPVWIVLPLNPDWRWLLERKDSPWYPTARLFRQLRNGDWDGVMRAVQGKLEIEFGTPTGETSPDAPKVFTGAFLSPHRVARLLMWLVLFTLLALAAYLLQ